MFASGYSYVFPEIWRHSVLRGTKLSMELAFPLKLNLTFQQIFLKMIQKTMQWVQWDLNYLEVLLQEEI